MGGVYGGGNVRPGPAHTGLQSAQQQASLNSHLLLSCLSSFPGMHRTCLRMVGSCG